MDSATDAWVVQMCQQQGEQRTEWRMANGEWRMANGEWRMANGEWRTANGEWRMANGEWRMANGEWRTAEAFVLPNAYEPGRAHVVIYNWSGEKMVEVPVGKVLADGEEFRLYDPKNLYGDPVYRRMVTKSIVLVPTAAEFTVVVLRSC